MILSVARAISTGAADILASRAPDTFVAADSGDYTDAGDRVPLFVGFLPESPDRVLAINPYTVDVPGTGITTYGLQLRARDTVESGDPDAIIDAASQVLDGLENVTLRGKPVPLVWLQSAGSIGPDQNGRPETVANFYLHVGRASAGTD